MQSSICIYRVNAAVLEVPQAADRYALSHDDALGCQIIFFSFFLSVLGLGPEIDVLFAGRFREFASCQEENHFRAISN